MEILLELYSIIMVRLPMAFDPSGEWVKGTGHGYLDGVAVLIALKFLLMLDLFIH